MVNAGCHCQIIHSNKKDSMLQITEIQKSCLQNHAKGSGLRQKCTIHFNIGAIFLLFTWKYGNPQSTSNRDMASRD
jgi:hypothetical protein